MSDVPFSFDDGDLDALLARPGVDVRTEEVPLDLAPSDDLRGLTRKLAGQYVEVIARFASQAFSGRQDAAAAAQLRFALTAVGRLCASCGQTDLLERVQVIEALADREPPRRGRGRERFLAELRWSLLALADRLDPADAERLRRTLTYDGAREPLLDALSNLPGIGPKRLERLYCAGLFRIEAVAAASADEIAQVTGLPRPLAEAVVHATLAFAKEQRKKAVDELLERVMDLNAMIAAVPVAATEQEELIGAARSGLSNLQTAIDHLERIGRTS